MLFKNNFDAVYNDKLNPALSGLKGNHKLVIVSAILTRLFEIYFVTVVVSLFLGFMNMFPFDELPGGSFSKIIRGFMYFVLTIVVLIIVSKQIKIMMGEREIIFSKNKFLIHGITFIITSIVIACARFIGIKYLGKEMDFQFMLRWAGGIFSVFVLIFPYNLIKKVENKFNEKYKEIFLTNSLPAISSEIKYEKQKFITPDEFDSSHLFKYQRIDTYTGSDLFTGSESNLHGSNLLVKEIETTSSNGKTETKISELFKGFLFIADFNKSFKGETYILTDLPRSLMGEIYGEFINHLVHSKQTKLVVMENPDFEEMFVVYATDEVEARYILSTKLMERITEFKNNFYQDILISFIGNKMYIAVQADKELFVPNIFGKIDDYNYLQKQFNYLHTLLTIPEQFDLKTKIWN